MAKCRYDSYDRCPFQLGEKCPKNTDNNCNIVKPKPKLKRVKAWVAINRDGDMYSVWLPIHKGEMHEDVYKPCTIIIDAKHLKGKGGKK